ncbi:MAG TPA: U32 family peptidase [Alphaproteobacteria bacterium]|jgi:collagenase-like PrtC family protease
MRPALVLGPVQFNWPPEKWRDFHFRVADEAPVDCVHVGEVVCAKRAPFVAPYLPDVVERLERSGKEVVVSTLALIGGERDAAMIRELVAGTDRLIEANDLGVVQLLAGRPHMIGPMVNVYNEHALAFLAARGAVRVCLPAELPAASLAALAAAPDPVELEVLAFGRVPLAISARCFHARAHGLHKDGCRYVCGNDPDGLAVDTVEGRAFLAVNGTQTLSHAYANIAGEVGAIMAMGIGRLRLAPHDCDMVGVATVFHRLAAGEIELDAAQARLRDLLPGRAFANGFFHAAPGHREIRQALADPE